MRFNKSQKANAMTLVRFNKKPRTDVAPFFSAFDDFFARPFEDMFRDNGGSLSTPAINVLEKEDHFAIEVAAPGLRKEDFTLKVEDDTLFISAERKEEHESSENEGRYTRREFAYTSFQRSFTLPETINSEAIGANYTDGILNIRLPKREEAKAKPIRQIEVG
jgi:HSP20 family protein